MMTLITVMIMDSAVTAYKALKFEFLSLVQRLTYLPDVQIVQHQYRDTECFGNFDLVFTRSEARFARLLLDCEHTSEIINNGSKARFKHSYVVYNIWFKLAS